MSDTTASKTQAPLVTWNDPKGFGIAQGNRSFKDRYYVHVSEINAPPTTQIQVGMWFEFDVLPPKHPWQFPRAVNAFLIAAPKVGGLS